MNGTPPRGVWYKSSRSDASKACVEVRHDGDATLVRDTKDGGLGPILSFTPEVWNGFLESGIWKA